MKRTSLAYLICGAFALALPTYARAADEKPAADKTEKPAPKKGKKKADKEEKKDDKADKQESKGGGW